MNMKSIHLFVCCPTVYGEIGDGSTTSLPLTNSPPLILSPNVFSQKSEYNSKQATDENFVQCSNAVVINEPTNKVMESDNVYDDLKLFKGPTTALVKKSIERSSRRGLLDL